MSFTSAAILGAGALGAFGAIKSADIAADAAEDAGARARQPQVFEQSLINDLFTGQQAILLGANPDEVAENFILNRVNRNVGPDAARSIARELDSIASLLLQAESTTNVGQANSFRAQADQALTRLNTQFRSAGVGVPVDAAIEGGQLVYNFADPGINRFIQEARLIGPGIRAQRTSGIAKFNALLGGPTGIGTPGEFERFRGLSEQQLLSELVDRETQARDQALTTAQAGNFSPAASLQRISELGLLSRGNIENQSLDRAFGLVAEGQKLRATEASILEGILFPVSVQNTLGREAGTAASTNQLAAAQLASSTQAGLAAAAARGSGSQGAFSAGADAITLAALFRSSGGPAGQGSQGITGLSGFSPFAV